MKASVILAHPRNGSFNHAIANTVIATLQGAGHEVHFHDLYQEGFDPLLEASELSSVSKMDPLTEVHCNEIAQADAIFIIHPNWWGMPPAILKGWVDRVLRSGVAYKFFEGDNGEGVPRGLLKAKTALVINTTDTPYGREMEVFGDPLNTIWKNCILHYCGVKAITRKSFGVIVTSSIEERNKWLSEVRDAVSNCTAGL
nr:NAD(P)H-dependent oxidoreductase [uncultured Holophaga sp.]